MPKISRRRNLKARHAIRDDTNTLLTLIDSIQDEVWFADENENFVLVNRAGFQEFNPTIGQEKKIEKVAASLEVYRPDGTPRPIEEAPPLLALKGQIVRNQEEIVRTPGSGELRHRQVTSSPVKNGEGKIIGSISIVRDITERKKAEELLRQSERKYRQLFESMTEGFLLVEPVSDESGKLVSYRYLDANPALSKLTHLKPEQIIGKDVRDILPVVEPYWIETFNRVATTGNPERIEEYSEALKGWYDVYVYCPERGKAALVYTNINDRKRAEEELAARLRFEMLLSQLSARFVNIPAEQMDKAIEDAQRDVCQCLGLDGSTLWQWTAGTDRFCTLTHSYRPEGSRPLPERINAQDLFPWAMQQLMEGKLVAVSSTKGLPKEAARDQEIFNRYGVKASLTIPLLVGINSPLGFLAFNVFRSELEWKAPIVRSLQLVAQIFANALARIHSERALRNNEERLRSLGDNLPDSAVYQYMQDPDGKIRFLYISAGIEKLNGVRAEDVLRDPAALNSQIPPLYLEQLNEAVKTSRMNLSDFDMEVPMKRPDGQVRWIRIHSRPRRLPDGRTIWDGVQSDITVMKRTQEALRDSYREFAAIFEQSIVGKGEGDPANGRFVRVNQALADLTGYSIAELCRMTSVDLTHPDDRQLDLEILEKVTTGQVDKWQSEKRYVRKDRSVIWVSVSGNSIRNGEGKPVRTIFVVQDITERKRAEEALRENRNRFKVLTDNIDAGVAFIDENGRFAIVNPAFLRLFDLPGDTDVRNIKDRDWAQWQVFGENRELLDVDDHPVRKAALTGKPVREQLVGVLSPSGGPLKWMLISAEPILKSDGRLDVLIATYHDITQLKQTQEALSESEGKYRNLFENMTEEVHFWQLVRDEQGQIKTWRLVDANPPTLKTWGRDTVEKIRGKTTDEIFGPGATEHYMPLVRKIMDEGIPHSYEDYFQNLDKHFRFTSVPLGDYFITTGADITGIKRAQEILARANEELEKRVAERTAELAKLTIQLRALAGELTLTEQRERRRLAGVLHDHLQQLLVGAKFRTSVLGRSGDETTRHTAKEIEDLIDESIKSSRSLTAELSPPILHDAGLNAGLEWLGRRMADTQGLFVELEAEQIGTLADDLTILIFESVRELLFNVVKHADTRSAGVSLRRVNGSLEVIVSDQGVGFDPKALPPPGEGGRGFGLFGIRERLGLFGGRLIIRSAPGQGSRFVVSVPITDVESQPIELTEISEAVHRDVVLARIPGRKIRVLLADDHIVVRQGIANLLNDEQDIEVVGAATDGQEAVSLASSLLPDVILMDLNMPKLNGIEATRVIHNEFRDVCIIGLSMYEEADRAQAMRDAGAVDYLTKSGPAEELINSIRRNFRQKKTALAE